MARTHTATVHGIAPPTVKPQRRDTDRPRALIYVEDGVVELHVIATDGLRLEPGDARLLAAALATAVADAELDR